MTKRPAIPAGLKTRAGATTFLQERGFPVTDSTLALAASRGTGPAFIKFGHKVFYADADLLAWAEGKLQVVGKPTPPFGGNERTDNRVTA